MTNALENNRDEAFFLALFEPTIGQSRHLQNSETGENLLEQAFEKITDSQIRDLQVRTGMQRIDSTLIASNIVNASRLQLLVEAIQRVHCILREDDWELLAESFAPYLTAGHYTYRVKGKTALDEHLQQVAAMIHHLMKEMKDKYAKEPAYHILERIFTEHFNLIEGQIISKENCELSSNFLQSTDDLEASYLIKGNTHYKGYGENLSETCDSRNELQIITKVHVAPNNLDDALQKEALPELKEWTELETLYTDGGYGSPEMDKTLAEEQIEQVQTAIRGRKPSPEKLHLSEFEIKQTEEGKPTQITCPNDQKVNVQPSSQRKSFVAHFAMDQC
jgi:hypothetical protein